MALGTSLFDGSQDAVVLIDARQRLCRLNPAAEAMLGVSLRQVRGRCWQDVFQIERPLASHHQAQPVIRCLKLRQSVRLPAHTVLVCGHRLRQRISGNVLPVALEGGHGALLVARVHLYGEYPGDETQLRFREHEALLAHMFRLNTVGELATGIAHELNQPLAAILSYSQASLRLLHQDEPDLERTSEALQETAAQARRAGQILHQLRAFVSKRPAEITPVAVNQIIINTLTLLAGPLQEAGIQVSLYTEPCPTVLADAIQLEQVMVNLVRNAIEAMQASPPESRLLRLGSRHQEGMVWVEVRDSGPGFSQAVQARLFTRFFSTKSQGMGLGLNISQTIIEAAGGSMEAQCPREGGALFRFSLPAQEKQNAEVRRVAESA
jgi:C4-dicarboxylate-specific signal transduction histidine kinase